MSVRGSLRKAFGNASLRFGAGLLATLTVLAVAGSLLLVDPNQQNLANALVEPGAAGHLLGTDPLGRDILAWLAGGVRTALLVSVAVVVLSAAVGTLIGLTAGFAGGWVDAALMRLVDLQLAVPPILLFIAASALLRPSVVALVLLLSVVGWVPYARIVRARVLSERERAYIAGARLAGAGRVRIITVHLLPSALTLVSIIGSLQAGYVLLWESGLSFLGLGVQPPTPSLGFMIAQGKDQLEFAWWVSTLPGLVIVLLCLSFNLIGDGLRDRFNVAEEEVSLR